MPSLTIKNIPEKLYDQLKLHAERHRRSINKEVIFIFETTLLKPAAEPSNVLTRIRKRRKTITHRLTAKEIAALINTGRP